MPEQPRPRRRDPRVHAAILTATRDLLIETGYERMTMEGIAARAGVGKQTVYRWWPAKSAVVAEVALTGRLVPSDTQVPDTGDVRADLTAWARLAVATLADPATAAVTRGLTAAAADRDTDADRLYAELAAPARDTLADRLIAGRRRGQVRPDIDLTVAADALVGSLLFWTLARDPARRPDPSALVDLVLAGVGVPEPTHPERTGRPRP